MKNTTIIVSLCLMSASLLAQKVDSKNVPATVKSGLEKHMGVKDAKWDKEGDNYEANFKKDGKEMSAVFDGAGILIETEVEIAKSELPAGSLDILKKDFADFKMEEIAKITSKGVISYEVEVEKGKDTWELIFDGHGKLLKKEQEKEEGEDKD